jgi:hypothetical protein
MTTTKENTGAGRFVSVCPPKALSLGCARRGRADEIGAQMTKMGFSKNGFMFLDDGGGLAVSDGPELFDDGKVVVAFCGELTNKEYLLQKLQADNVTVEKDLRANNISAQLVGKLFERHGDQPQGMMAKLRGTYTFVVYDIERVRMFGARDSSGPIPLYQTRLSDGTTVLSNYKTEYCDEHSEVPAGHYVYGARRCNFPQKFSPAKNELDRARTDAKEAVSKALQGILTRSELQPRLHSAMQSRAAARKSTERQRSPVKHHAAHSPPVVTVLSQTIHSNTPQTRSHKKQHNSASHRSDASTWWRKPTPTPLSASAAPFVMQTKEAAKPAALAPANKEVVPNPAEKVMADPEKEMIIEAVNQLHRIASSGKLQVLLKVQEQDVSSPRSALRRTPSCGEMDMVLKNGMQRVPSCKQFTDMSSLMHEAH